VILPLEIVIRTCTAPKRVSTASPVNVPETAVFVAGALAAGAGVAAVALAELVATAEFGIVVVATAVFFFFLVEALVVGVAAGAGVVVAAGAVVAGVEVVVEPESELPESDAPESDPLLSPPELPNCGGVIERTAPSPPMVPPTMSANLLDSMELKLLSMYS